MAAVMKGMTMRGGLVILAMIGWAGAQAASVAPAAPTEAAAGPQKAAEPSGSAQRSLRDDSVLISSVIDSVDRMKVLLNLPVESPKWEIKVDAGLEIFKQALEAVRRSIDSGAKEDFPTVARVYKETFGASGDAWTSLRTPFGNARDTLMMFNTVFRIKILEALGNDTAALRRLTQPFADIHLIKLESQIEKDREKLRRYRVKYGPASARLNILETALNYVILQGVPGFRSVNDSPGPLEFIASYSTAYFVLYQGETEGLPDEPQLASIFEAGLRCYIFKRGWGGTGILDRFLKPAYVTAGLAVGGREDGFLRWPFDGDSRYGAFASWGDIKVAVIGFNEWDRSRVLISRQFQFIPYLF
jgi:hypothetical protein